MMPSAGLVDRQQLEEADRQITSFQHSMESAAASGALDEGQLQRFVETVRELASRMNLQLAPQLDVESAAEIRERLIRLLTVDSKDQGPLDAADRYLVDLEAVRHVVRDLLEEQHPQALRREQNEIVALLESWLPTAPVPALARLLGLSVRQLQRARHERTPASSRMQLVARLVAILRHAWTDAGVVAWFDRPRRELAGRKPIELLSDPAREQQLLLAARSGRVQGGI